MARLVEHVFVIKVSQLQKDAVGTDTPGFLSEDFESTLELLVQELVGSALVEIQEQ